MNKRQKIDLSGGLAKLQIELADLRQRYQNFRDSLNVQFRYVDTCHGTVVIQEFAVFAGDVRLTDWTSVPDGR